MKYMSHFSYRTRQEIEKFRKERDPINTFKNRLIESGIAEQREFDDIEKEVKQIVSDAESKARMASKPDVRELSTDVYTEKVHNLHIITPDPKLCLDMSI
ncbi:hypothetical protein GJ496_000763 [Pomphorhynchus laevis]|nr:hypothetical protein GJ496_000763 [Pomphorhynchus laevis]